MESEIKEEIDAFMNASMDIDASDYDLSLKAELDYENQSIMSTCDQRSDNKSPVSELNSLSGESDPRLTKAIEKEVCVFQGRSTLVSCRIGYRNRWNINWMRHNVGSDLKEVRRI
ncbi:uncharacterized protein LOC120354215 [Nilaparvata lugens]|uniref:uncharacterized protein LOC120354215 n=1 Tax=Nilaparvata lugens TaxID=108931 RepID=UPI00193DCFBA|nr:uncharacterized protein LOC120354215 [Nilaparvata lugens]